MSRHIHKWFLAEYKKSSLVAISEKAMSFVPGTSLWVCECGREKQVDLKPQKLSAPKSSKGKP